MTTGVNVSVRSGVRSTWIGVDGQAESLSCVERREGDVTPDARFESLGLARAARQKDGDVPAEVIRLERRRARAARARAARGRDARRLDDDHRREAAPL